MNFTGKNALLKNVRGDNEMIVQFVLQWLDGSKERLESADINLKRDFEFDRDEFYEIFNFKRYDEDAMLEVFIHEFNFKKATGNRYPAFQFLKINKETALNFLYFHIHKLFRTAANDELEVDGKYGTDYCAFSNTKSFLAPDPHTTSKIGKWIPSFPNAENFKAVIFRRQVKKLMLDDCYKKYPNLKSVYFDDEYTYSDHDEEAVKLSLALKTECIHYFCDKIGASIISKFKGRCAVLSNVICADSTIIRFIRKWLDGSYEKLEILDVSLAEGSVLNSDEIFKKFDFKKHEKGEALGHLDSMLITHYPCDLHERSYWFLEHPTNGTIASVDIHPKCFHFYVWNKGVFPMKFLRLPFLVQELILKRMTFSELFILSICSRKIPDVIRKVLWKIETVRFFIREDFLEFKVKPYAEDFGRISFVSGLDKDQKLTMRLGTKTLEYCILKKTDETNPSIVLTKSIKEAVIPIFHEHLHYLFGSSASDELDMLKTSPAYTFPCSENLKTLFQHNTVRADDLERFVTLHPLTNIHINSRVEGEFENTSKILKIDHIFFKTSFHLAPSFILNFTSKFMVLHRAICDTATIITFVEQWMNGLHDKLEQMDVYFQFDTAFRPLEFLEAFDWKRYEKKITPATHLREWKYKRETKKRYPAFLFLKSSKDTALQFLYFHMHRLFRTAADDELEVDDTYCTPEFPDTKSFLVPDKSPLKTVLPWLPNGQNFKGIVFQQFVKMETLEDCYKKYPNIKSIRFNASIDDKAAKSPLLFQTENICVKQSGKLGPSIISNFKGRCALLRAHPRGSLAIIQTIGRNIGSDDIEKVSSYQRMYSRPWVPEIMRF
ncbi:hypothetical protein CAEBREN_31027 [Caenorhabditis brenneri]|uniref:F-box domain-containing protein n=1 Tax=Caenorhabditis brenneri TaxID=135651 RepID=G0PK78_CAEBE|nr:hypothetical protein CAEBREN_31027 [Caenorhabditis brenneri]